MIRRFPILIFFVLFLLLFNYSAPAAVSIGVGPEYFWWGEFNADGSRSVEESGFRSTLELHLEKNRDHGFLIGYHGKL